MTRTEKEIFTAHMADIFAPPGEALLADLKREASGSPEEEEISLSALRRDYDRLFVNIGGEKLSLVESTYKAWTADPNCSLGFSRGKGLLMGDCALHIRDIFQALNLSVPPDFQGTPDHLVLELELLSYLYRSAAEEQVRNFISDHLDWVASLRDEIRKKDAGFYSRAAERLLDFLNRELHPAGGKPHES